MKAILALELKLLRGSLSTGVLVALAAAVLAGCALLGQVAPLGPETARWLAPFALLLLLPRELQGLRSLDALVGSIPLRPADLLRGHFVFWGLVALLPAATIGLLAYGLGNVPSWGLFSLWTWSLLLVGVTLLGWVYPEVPAARQRGQIVFQILGACCAAAAFACATSYGQSTWMVVALLLGAGLLVLCGLHACGAREYLPALTPKRVRVGAASKPEEGEAVPWRRRRDREGMLQARRREARSPRGVLMHLLWPLVWMTVLGMWWLSAAMLAPANSNMDGRQAMGLVWLLGLMHLYLYLAVPRWLFLRQTPIRRRRVLAWLLAPLLVGCIPLGWLLMMPSEREGVPEIAANRYTGIKPLYLQGSDVGCLVVPPGMRSHMAAFPTPRWGMVPDEHGLFRLRYDGQPHVYDEAAYFEQVVSPYLRTRFHVDPQSEELRSLLGAPETADQVAALTMWGAFSDAQGHRFVDGELPFDIADKLFDSKGDELRRRARGDHLPGTQTPEDSTDRLAYEAWVAGVLAKWKKDGAVYDFGRGLLRVQAAFRERIRQARRATLALDTLGFLCVLLASLTWALRSPIARWLAVLVAAGFLLAWSVFAWWPLGTAVYVWGVEHLALALAAEVVLAGWLLARFLRALRSLDARAVENL